MGDLEEHSDTLTTLRQVVPNFRKIEGTSLFRSSKLDSVTEIEIGLLSELRVRCVFDLRSPEGWEDPSSTADVLDAHYATFTVKPASWAASVTGSGGEERNVQYQPILGRSSTAAAKEDDGTPAEESYHRHIYMNIIDKEFALGLLRNVVPWYAKPWIFGLMVGFLLTRTHLFLREFAKYAMNPIGIKGQYQGVLTYCGESICSALVLLSEPTNTPAVICCAQGKDRTGIIAALVMSVCGAQRQTIIREYAASTEYLAGLTEELQYYTDQYYLKREFASAEASTMESLLDFIDKRYGSVSDYLTSIGFGPDRQERLRQNVGQVIKE